MKFIERLRTLREVRELSQTEVAKVINVSQRVYSNYECGQVEPSIQSLIALADFFNVSLDYLLCRKKKK